MTVGRGSAWGEPIVVPDGVRVVASNAQLSEIVRGGPPLPTVGLRGGDLARTVSAPGDVPLVPGASATAAMVDLIEVTVGERRWWAAAHVVLRRSWWRGEVWCVMNAEYVGTADVAPRGHPNDGRLDVLHVAAQMTLRERWAARNRLPTGTHVPHPRLALRSVTEWTATPPRGARVHVDGQVVHTLGGEPVSIRCVADALSIVF